MSHRTRRPKAALAATALAAALALSACADAEMGEDTVSSTQVTAVEDAPQRAGAWLEEHEQAPRALRRLVIEHREDALRVRRVRAACAGV